MESLSIAPYNTLEYSVSQISHLWWSIRLDIPAALEFLETQQARVAQAEQALLQVTRELLPRPSLCPLLTTMEVAQVLQELSSIYQRQHQRLRQQIPPRNKPPEPTTHEPFQPPLNGTVDAQNKKESLRHQTLDSLPRKSLLVTEDTFWSPWSDPLDSQRDDTSIRRRPSDPDTVLPTTPFTTATPQPTSAHQPLTPFVRLGRVLSDVVEETDQETDGSTSSGSPVCPAAPLGNHRPHAATTRGARVDPPPSLPATRTPTTPNPPLGSAPKIRQQQQQHKEEEPKQSPYNNNPPSTGRKRLDAFAQLERTLQHDIHKVILWPSQEVVDQPTARTVRLASPQPTAHASILSTAQPDDQTLQDDDDLSSIVPFAEDLPDSSPRSKSRSSLVVPPEEEEDSCTTMALEHSLEEEDDSALYCATVLANRTDSPKLCPEGRQPPPHRPSQVQFVLKQDDDDDESPTDQTVLTMDDTMELELHDEPSVVRNPQLLHPIDETRSVNSGEESAETPILDRYRLVADETAPHGVVVVPNERRAHRPTRRPADQYPHRKHAPKAGHSKNGEPTMDKISEVVPSNSLSSPVSVRPKFRKTPHPHKQGTGYGPLRTTLHENAPLNTLEDDVTPTANNCTTTANTMWATPTEGPPSTTTTTRSSRSPLQSILWASAGSSRGNMSLLTSPATRPVALKTTTTSVAAATNTWTEQSPDAGFQTTPFHEEETQHVSRPPVDGTAERDSPHLKETALAASSDLQQSYLPQIKQITNAEYESAPRIVKMQLSMEKVQAAVVALNHALSLSPILLEEDDRGMVRKPDVELSQGDLQDILAPLSHRECKSVAMSLCHWRRLLLRRRERTCSPRQLDHLNSTGKEEPTEKEMVFAVLLH